MTTTASTRTAESIRMTAQLPTPIECTDIRGIRFTATHASHWAGVYPDGMTLRDTSLHGLTADGEKTSVSADAGEEPDGWPQWPAYFTAAVDAFAAEFHGAVLAEAGAR